MSHPLLSVLDLSVGDPVLVKSVGMGIHVGRLAGCEGRAVALTDSRHIRSWSGVGGSGSLYHLAVSTATPADRGPVMERQLMLDCDGVIPLSPASWAALGEAP